MKIRKSWIWLAQNWIKCFLKKIRSNRGENGDTSISPRWWAYGPRAASVVAMLPTLAALGATIVANRCSRGVRRQLWRRFQFLSPLVPCHFVLARFQVLSPLVPSHFVLASSASGLFGSRRRCLPVPRPWRLCLVRLPGAPAQSWPRRCQARQRSRDTGRQSR